MSFETRECDGAVLLNSRHLKSIFDFLCPILTPQYGSYS